MTQSPTDPDPQLILKLASIGATEDEICDYLNITHEQIRQLCGKDFDARQAWFRIILRQKQFEHATKNPTSQRMLIWLGNCYLRRDPDDTWDDNRDDDYKDNNDDNDNDDENPDEPATDDPDDPDGPHPSYTFKTDIASSPIYTLTGASPCQTSPNNSNPSPR